MLTLDFSPVGILWHLLEPLFAARLWRPAKAILRSSRALGFRLELSIDFNQLLVARC
jgi:hypothetical protein